MYVKTDIIPKLNSLKEYTIATKTAELNQKCENEIADLIDLTEIEKIKEFYAQTIKDCEQRYIALMQPLYQAVNNYFNADRSSLANPLNRLAEYMHGELWEQLSKWDNKAPNYSGSRPQSYYDLTKIFYTFDWINTSNETFYNAWAYVTPETETTEEEDEHDPEPLPSSNSLVKSWISSIDNGKNQELPNINSLNEHLENSMCSISSFNLWEDRGTLYYAPETKDLAQTIFIDRKLIEVSKKLNIPVYIPTYLRGN